jgi:hypothetical protein
LSLRFAAETGMFYLVLSRLDGNMRRTSIMGARELSDRAQNIVSMRRRRLRPLFDALFDPLGLLCPRASAAL